MEPAPERRTRDRTRNNEPYNFEAARLAWVALRVEHELRGDQRFPREIQHAEAFGRRVGRIAPLPEAGEELRWRDFPEIDAWSDIPERPEFDDPHYVPYWAHTQQDWETHLRRAADNAAIEELRARAGRPVTTPVELDKVIGVYAAEPPPQRFGVSDNGAEHLVAHWLRYLGAHDAVVTQYVGDGGIDVASEAVIAQVKNYAPNRSVGVADLRQLGGVAAVDGRPAAFFTSGTYASGSIAFAEQASIALFRYVATEGRLMAMDTLAADMKEHGIHL
ncbi:restriction endonuclease [Microbacterium murale]|uniref:Restriction endonuclease type IV Mrr domain-containing protein n=1 Tax=Microbacterium murale TaxID=1081040 RepID=A0ABQ1RQG5_9MICO|nr:restriction endonuclease [Microbacterium murale]GGD76906.1 hypothetical protein GCM10007269_19790 [Microbacterium murale]